MCFKYKKSRAYLFVGGESKEKSVEISCSWSPYEKVQRQHKKVAKKLYNSFTSQVYNQVQEGMGKLSVGCDLILMNENILSARVFN